MATRVEIVTDTSTLAKAMWPGSALYDFNAGTYEGTKIPLRKLTGAERVRVSGTTAGARVLADETWIADRFGNLGARQVKRLLALVETASARRSARSAHPGVRSRRPQRDRIQEAVIRFKTTAAIRAFARNLSEKLGGYQSPTSIASKVRAQITAPSGVAIFAGDEAELAANAAFETAGAILVSFG